LISPGGKNLPRCPALFVGHGQPDKGGLRGVKGVPLMTEGQCDKVESNLKIWGVPLMYSDLFLKTEYFINRPVNLATY
jgi:hypothetical protein